MATGSTVFGAIMVAIGLPVIPVLPPFGIAIISVGSIVILYGLLGNNHWGLRKEILSEDMLWTGPVLLILGFIFSTAGFPGRYRPWLPPNPTVGLPMMAMGAVILAAGMIWRRRTNQIGTALPTN